MSTVYSGDRELLSERAAPGLLGLAERGWLPDLMIRAGIRALCAQRLEEESAGGPERQTRRFRQRLALLQSSPIAIHTAEANSEHYELPAAFFARCLGRRLKYSCAYYPRGDETLDEAELAMLDLYAERAELADGQQVLELGCGWGSLTLWLAERYPNSTVTAISNSAPQRDYIVDQCARRRLENVRVLTQDVNRLQLDPEQFDRCVSIEMFEHLRNYTLLFERIAAWLRPQGKLFVHVFAHRLFMYPFETSGHDNWLGRHFFTGGLMPSTQTLPQFQKDLRIERCWDVCGRHYQRTAEHWLRNQDGRRSEIVEILARRYGRESATLWFNRWRMFWMACSELFGYADGTEWIVAHYRFVRR